MSGVGTKIFESAHHRSVLLPPPLTAKFCNVLVTALNYVRAGANQHEFKSMQANY
jgi:hypothetical protein